MEFVRKLANAPSGEEIENILGKDRRKFRDIDLVETLHNVYFGSDSSRGFIREFEDARRPIAIDRYGPPNDEDTDLGPYEAWRTENEGWGVPETFAPGANTWLRGRAYVLCDSERVRRMGRLKK